jgi:PTH1 family peptidyl-tRNA hydrolase
VGLVIRDVKDAKQGKKRNAKWHGMSRAGENHNMYIIVGLGNLGKQYENTRHNIGFDVIDRLADEEHIAVLEKKHKAVIGKGIVAGQKCILAKPTTYMNLSGESVRELIDYYKVDEESELIIIADDVSLDVGRLRVRKKGSAGGHNGLKSIISHLGHDTFVRVKMGVGEKPKGWDLADYVLGHFTTEERKVMNEAAAKAADAIRLIIREDADAAMNAFNRAKNEEA